MIGSLVCLHLHEYRRDKSSTKSDPLKLFRKHYKPLALSTCMRHVYLLRQDEIAAVNNKQKKFKIKPIIAGIKTNATQFQYLTGFEAYHFCLQWAAGGFGKLEGNDHFVLSEIRTCWQAALKSPRTLLNRSYAKRFASIMNSLLMDASKIRHAVQTFHLAGKEDADFRRVKPQKIIVVCAKRVIYARKRRAIPPYKALLFTEKTYYSKVEHQIQKRMAKTRLMFARGDRLRPTERWKCLLFESLLNKHQRTVPKEKLQSQSTEILRKQQKNKKFKLRIGEIQ